MSVQNYIHDGYTRDDGYISAVPRLHNELRFKWRPILAQRRSGVYRAMDAVAESDPAQAESIAAKAMEAQLIGWDLKDKDGKEVTISQTALLRLAPALGGRLFRILMGREAPDEDPRLLADARSAQSEDLLERALSNNGPEETDAKN